MLWKHNLDSDAVLHVLSQNIHRNNYFEVIYLTYDIYVIYLVDMSTDRKNIENIEIFYIEIFSLETVLPRKLKRY